MKSGKPWSHIVSILLFALMAIGFYLAVQGGLQKGAKHLTGALFFAGAYAAGVVVLLRSPTRWAYYFCATLLAFLPGIVFIGDIVVLFTVGSSSLATVAPSFVLCAVLFLWFYWFTFGQESRQFYGFSSE